jgi:hypothetical protein
VLHQWLIRQQLQRHQNLRKMQQVFGIIPVPMVVLVVLEQQAPVGLVTEP